MDSKYLQPSGIAEAAIEPAMSALVKKMEDEARAVLNAFWAPMWTMEDVKRRCQIVRVAGSPIETLCADGIPLLEMHPLESHMELKDDRYVVTYTRKFRNLRAAHNT